MRPSSSALVESARAYAGECAKRNDTTLPYLSTDAVARDLDALRVAVGDDKLTYLGFSYGTLIGSIYADLFPDHIRAMVLDGAIDPSLDLEGLRAGQAKGFETELRQLPRRLRGQDVLRVPRGRPEPPGRSTR